MDTIMWLILCFGIGVIGTFIGYTIGGSVTSKYWQKIVATREEAFRKHWNR